jgi:hypothetical protein
MRQVVKQQNVFLREDWLARIQYYKQDQFVFVDESACNGKTLD